MIHLGLIEHLFLYILVQYRSNVLEIGVHSKHRSIILTSYHRYAQRFNTLNYTLGSSDTSGSGKGTKIGGSDSIPSTIGMLHLQGARAVVRVVQTLLASNTSIIQVRVSTHGSIGIRFRSRWHLQWSAWVVRVPVPS